MFKSWPRNSLIGPEQNVRREGAYVLSPGSDLNWWPGRDRKSLFLRNLKPRETHTVGWKGLSFVILDLLVVEFMVDARGCRGDGGTYLGVIVPSTPQRVVAPSWTRRRGLGGFRHQESVCIVRIREPHPPQTAGIEGSSHSETRPCAVGTLGGENHGRGKGRDPYVELVIPPWTGPRGIEGVQGIDGKVLCNDCCMDFQGDR